MSFAEPGKGYELYPLGEAAVVIRWDGTIGERTRLRVDGTVRRLDRCRNPAITEWARAYTTVTVYYDPWRVYEGRLAERSSHSASGMSGGLPDASPYDLVCAWVHEQLQGLEEELGHTEASLELRTIPVCFGLAYGPDLEEVARRSGLSPEEAVAMYCSALYTVHLIGFAPGFPYLGGLPERLENPRRSEPRAAVPAGSVGIAGSQTGIYPAATPGGWQLIGRTPLRLFDPAREPASLLLPGDRVRFEPVSAARYKELEARLSRAQEEAGEDREDGASGTKEANAK
ncbi:5-oxoprolinase subunit PxpB [Paenibacillus filicis]|uniref:5-oxoprolinase subunit PxpB n=1 Tax=Paenibacillus gyeongsangnamensis TaxID=3388067 RepID=A0ABT4QLW2_9BACL|nr:5-oxoprolinase subunit PxpB [Paenibacillus filicis]MCZ8517705.1 5-oxoprolinase subunit PxpB [Paenibacillus filicis]